MPSCFFVGENEIKKLTVKLVIFDFDGTLGDTRHNIVVTMQQVMRLLGLAVADEQTCASTIGLPLSSCFSTIYKGMTDEEAEHCAEAYRQYFFENAKRLVPQSFPHVKETLTALKQQRLSMAIASSRTSRSLLGFVNDMGFAPYISHVVGCEDVAHPKPHPESVRRILSAMGGIDAAEAIMVGDMPVDIHMGQAAGTRTCAVTYGNASRDELTATKPDYMIDDISQLIAIIERHDLQHMSTTM